MSDGERPPDPALGTMVRNLQAEQRLFGRYVLKNVLGRGGMGIVWLAYDEHLDRDVALKFLPDVVQHDLEAVAELKRETRRALALTHPHIVRIHDFLQSPEAACICMEAVKGESLAALKMAEPNGCFQVSRVRPWLGQLVEALGYAHETARVVHRDLKPANLLLTRGGQVKITDFGIASSLSDTMTRLTAQFPTSGTPPYSSPQQLLGESPTPLDDIYALGATFYDLLTGKPPFFRGDILAQVRHVTPPPMEQRRAELGQADDAHPPVWAKSATDFPDELDHAGEPISPEWESVIAACLSKNPAERPQSVRELAERLNLDDADKTPAVRLVGDQQPPHAKGKLPWKTLGAALVVCLLVGFGFDTIRRRVASVWTGRDGRQVGLNSESARPLEGVPMPTPPAAAPTLPPKPTPGPPKAPPAQAVNHFEQALLEGRQLRDRGDMNSALVKFREASAMDPKNTVAIAELAATYEKMGAMDRAGEQWRKIFDIGNAKPLLEAPADAALDGIAAGATLGLLPVRAKDEPDSNSSQRFTLHIPIKARPKTRIEVRDLVIQVLFYDIVDGKNVVQTTANVSSRWITPPADWLETDTEELAVEYQLPKPKAGAAKAETRKYFGYIVRLFYKQQLQAGTAEPESLGQQYPPPLTLPKEPDK